VIEEALEDAPGVRGRDLGRCTERSRIIVTTRYDLPPPRFFTAKCVVVIVVPLQLARDRCDLSY
jgi:hypothetical protein